MEDGIKCSPTLLKVDHECTLMAAEFLWMETW